MATVKSTDTFAGKRRQRRPAETDRRAVCAALLALAALSLSAGLVPHAAAQATEEERRRLEQEGDRRLEERRERREDRRQERSERREELRERLDERREQWLQQPRPDPLPTPQVPIRRK